MDDVSRKLLAKAMSTTSDAEALACIRKIKKDWSPPAEPVKSDRSLEIQNTRLRQTIYRLKRTNNILASQLVRAEKLEKYYRHLHTSARKKKERKELNIYLGLVVFATLIILPAILII